MNIAHIWQELLLIVSQEAGSRVVETWFKAITFSQWDAATKTVYITAPNGFVRDWVATHYSPILKTHLSRLLNTQVSLLFLDGSMSALQEVPVRKTSSIAHQPQAATQPVRYQVNKRYDFDSYIVGDHNAVAVAAAQAIAASPGGQYNPFFIVGGAGMGKTHLLQAVGNSIQKGLPQARVLYQSADRFVHEFVNAIRFDKAKSFEQRYKDADVLLVDDIQLLSHKEQTQEAFFHIFNALYEKGKQIIFSADTLPDQIEGLSDRLKSRLSGSLITVIQVPSVATKVAILQDKALRQNTPLQSDVAQYIATRSSSNVRELEGLLIRVLACATLTHQALTLDLAHKVLARNLIEHRQVAPLDLPQVAAVVAKKFNTSITDLRLHKRQKSIVDARHVSMYLMKRFTEHSLRDIATYWCRKDHTTVLHAIAKIESLRLTDGLLNQRIEELEREFKHR